LLSGVGIDGSEILSAQEEPLVIVKRRMMSSHIVRRLLVC
jgi:hypothetical protein